jgi:protein-tyrosine phosphatase
MIDIHCHILPGLDDGPAEMEESLAMGRLYAAVGFKTVVATPHCIPGTRWMPDIPLIESRVRMLSAALAAEGVALRIHAGMEIALDPLVPRLIRQNRLLPLAGGPYFLIECPFQRLPLGWEEIPAAILRMGHKVLLAHPERCAQLAETPSLVDDIVATGVYVQVNWDSLAGLNGRHVQKVALAFAGKRHIHCLATDSHDPVRRSPEILRSTAGAAEAVMNRENLHRLMAENPRRVVTGEDLAPLDIEDMPVPIQAGRRRWFRFK